MLVATVSGAAMPERFLQPLDDLLLMLGDQFRHQRRDLRDDRFHLGDVGEQHRRQLGAFAATHVDQIGNRLLAAREHRIAQRFRRHAAFGQHARPAQDFAGAQAPRFRKRVQHRAFQQRELGQRIMIDRARIGRLFAALQIDTNIHLAARELVHQHFAQGRLADAHVFGHAEVQIEKARVHRAQFDRYAHAAIA